MNREADILTRIEATTNILTKAEKKVAQYVLSNPREVLYTSITDLAELCQVGDTTVFRFCKTLRLKGYQEFKMMLAQALSNVEVAPGDTDDIAPADSLEAVVRKTLAASTGALGKTRDLIDYRRLSEAVDALVGAGTVMVYGAGSSLITALEAANKFLRITPKFFCHMDSHQQAMAAAQLSPRDVALAISFSGATKDTVAIAGIAKRQGAGVISITRFEKSPLSSSSDITLLCGANEGPLQGGSTSGKMSQLFLLDVLYTEYFKRTYRDSSENNARAAEAVLEKLY